MEKFSISKMDDSIGAQSLGDAVLDQADVAIYSVDAEGRCSRFNRAAERLLGYTAAEAMGRDMHELLHSRYPDGSSYPKEDCPLMLSRVASRALSNLAEVLWTKSGEAVSVECSAAPLAYQDGSSAGAVITIKDVRARHAAEEVHRTSLREQSEALRQRDAAARVERELAETESQRQRHLAFQVEQTAAEELRKQQELISAVAESAPVGIAVLDANLEYQWQNQCYQKFLDAQTPWDALSEHVKDESAAPAEKDKEAVHQILRSVSETGQRYVANEFKLTGFGGTPSFWHWSASRLAGDSVMIIAQDVTEQVNARREIESIYATAPIALAQVDARTFRYLRVNEQQASILGLPPAEIVGKKVEDLTGVPEVKALLQRAADGQTVLAEALSGKLQAEPDLLRHWLLNVVPNREDGLQVKTISMAGIEVTAQKRAEEALMQADKLASVGRLVSSISHEINNPLEAVTNLLYLLHQETGLSDQAAEYIMMAEGEIARVSQIASQTLRFHRHAVGLVTRTPQQIVEPVVALYRGRLTHSNIQLQTEYPTQDPVVCREGDVRQILNNLVGNAVDAIDDGGTILIRTRAARCARTGRRGTRISVSDSGHGMRAETASHIFEPFYTTKGEGGSGLGLWISYTLAQRQGGTLQVRSCAEGVRASGSSGTTFSLFLPYPDASEAGAVAGTDIVQ